MFKLGFFASYNLYSSVVQVITCPKSFSNFVQVITCTDFVLLKILTCKLSCTNKANTFVSSFGVVQVSFCASKKLNLNN